MWPGKGVELPVLVICHNYQLVVIVKPCFFGTSNPLTLINAVKINTYKDKSYKNLK